MTYTLTAPGIPQVDIDPFALGNLADPTPMEDLLRDAGSVVFLPAHDIFAVARHDAVQQVLQDWQHFESGQGVGLSNFRKVRRWRATSAVLEADPPHHDAPRRVLADLLGPTTQSALREQWTATAHDLIRNLLQRRSDVDGVRDLAAAFPLTVIPDAIGIGAEGRDKLVPFSDFLLNAFGPRNDLVRRDQDTGAPLSAWVDEQCRRQTLRTGSWGAKIWEASDAGHITPDQAPLVLRSLFAAGVNTTVHALAALLYGLARHPQQWHLVRDQPQMRAAALDEAVRWHSPIQTMFRTTRGDVDICGYTIPDNAKVLLCVGAANRDPRRWERPATFDITRGPAGHVGFGTGIHGCVGQHLARLEAECLLGALAEHVQGIELLRPPTRRLNNTLNALETLPIRLHRADQGSSS